MPPTLYNPTTKMFATPSVGVTPTQQSNAISQGFNQAITGADLTKSDPIKVTDPIVGTSYAGVSANAVGQANQFVTDQAQQAKDQAVKTAETNAAGAKQTFFEKLLNRKTESGVQAEQYATQGVDVNKQELNDINNRILASEQAQKNELRALETASGGTVQGKQEAAAAINRKYAFEQSDLAVIQLAKQGKYDSAREVADRKVSAILEEEKNQIEAYKFNYEENKELFTKKEQRQYEENIKKADREYAKKEQFLTRQNDLLLKAIESGAPESVLRDIRNATDEESALRAAGPALRSKVKAPEVKSINGVDMQWNGNTGQWEPIPASTTAQPTLQLAQAQGNVQAISGLLNDTAIRTAVGPNILARFVGRGLDSATGARQNFIASVEQIRSNLNLEALIGAKSRGATFGALSDQELQVLASSATKIGTWAMKDKNGNITGYNASEKDFAKELNKINNFAKLDFILKGGDPMDVDSQLMPDGSIWTTNSDGTYTQIK